MNDTDQVVNLDVRQQIACSIFKQFFLMKIIDCIFHLKIALTIVYGIRRDEKKDWPLEASLFVSLVLTVFLQKPSERTRAEADTVCDQNPASVR